MSLVQPLLHIPIALAQAAARVDTLVAVAAPPSGWQWWVQILASIATIVIAVALIAIALAAITAVVKLRGLPRKIAGLAQRMQGDVQPILRHAEEVAENVNYVSSSIRGDVEEFKRRLDAAQARLTRASDAAEQRIHEFNALLRVVQQEAEDIFIDTASTIRGVRAGVNTLQGTETEPNWLEGIDEEDVAAPDPGRRRNQ